ncbi:unnamed protein product [Prunus brigantina]
MFSPFFPISAFKVNQTVLEPWTNTRPTKILPRHSDDNLRYVGGLKRVLVGNGISFADLRCQLLDEGVQNADASGDWEKNEDEDDFSFAPDGSPIPPIIYSKMPRSVRCSRFSTGISCSPMPTTTKLPEPKGLPLRLPICDRH